MLTDEEADAIRPKLVQVDVVSSLDKSQITFPGAARKGRARMPPPSANDFDLTKLLSAVQSALTSIGIVVGGLWAYYSYFRGRTFRSRLEPRLKGKVSASDGLWLLVAMAELRNVGLGKVPIQQKGTALRVYAGRARGSNGETTNIDWERLDTLSVFEKHAWIEPGEIISDTAALGTRSADLSAFKLELRVVSEGLEWTATTIVEAVKPCEPAKAEED